MSPPTFPAEIWRAILRFSVEIPGSLDTKWNYSPDILVWSGWDLPDCYIPPGAHNQEYFSALATKLSIVQVSRTWREIGVELLYEYLLFVDDDEDLEDLELVFQPMAMVADIFERHANESGYGRATKRVDVPISAIHHSTLPILIRLLDSCHNLRIFIVSNGPARRETEFEVIDLPGLSSLLQTRFSHSLRRIRFDLNCFDMPDPLKPHNLHLPLDSLELSTDSPLEPGDAISTVSALTVQTAYHSLLNMASWHCPALRHLALIDVDEECFEDLSFLISHGPQLISLALFFYDLDHAVRLSRLIAPATNLRCLVFDIMDAHKFMKDDIFPSITHIGMHSMPSFDQTSPSIKFFSTSIFPNLQCLRFLWISDKRPRWVFGIAREFRHVRVENKHCQLIL